MSTCSQLFRSANCADSSIKVLLHVKRHKSNTLQPDFLRLRAVNSRISQHVARSEEDVAQLQTLCNECGRYPKSTQCAREISLARAGKDTFWKKHRLNVLLLLVEDCDNNVQSFSTRWEETIIAMKKQTDNEILQNVHYRQLQHSEQRKTLLSLYIQDTAHKGERTPYLQRKLVRSISHLETRPT